MKQRFKAVHQKDGNWEGRELNMGDYKSFKATPSLFLIREAWVRGMNVDDLCDGFGPGVGALGDWSAIRDSSPEAIDAMLTRALNFHFPSKW